MNYSISDIEQLTGISSHSIRIWERRYNVVTPIRTAGNIRIYDDEQLKRLLNISALAASGHRISTVCGLTDEAINELLGRELTDLRLNDANFDHIINKLLQFGLSYDEYRVDKVLSSSISAYGMAETYKNIIYPLIKRLGLMWAKADACPAQEHFLSAILRRKIFSAIDGGPAIKSNQPAWLLFLPEDEDHDIGLLLAWYILKLHGKKVIFLGSRVPLNSVQHALMNNNISNLLLFMVRGRKADDTLRYLDDVISIAGKSQLSVAGNFKSGDSSSISPKINWITSLQQLEQIILRANDKV